MTLSSTLPQCHSACGVITKSLRNFGISLKLRLQRRYSHQFKTLVTPLEKDSSKHPPLALKMSSPPDNVALTNICFSNYRRVTFTKFGQQIYLKKTSASSSLSQFTGLFVFHLGNLITLKTYPKRDVLENRCSYEQNSSKIHLRKFDFKKSLQTFIQGKYLQ